MSFMSETTKVCLIDTNILVYAYDCTDQKKHKLAQQLLEKCWKKEVFFAISSQNLAEFFIIITKKVPSPIPVEEAQQIITDICSFSTWKILHYTERTLSKAITLYQKKQKHFWDALITATMLEAGITTIYTENVGDFQQFDTLTVINPFS